MVGNVHSPRGRPLRDHHGRARRGTAGRADPARPVLSRLGRRPGELAARRARSRPRCRTRSTTSTQMLAAANAKRRARGAARADRGGHPRARRRGPAARRRAARGVPRRGRDRADARRSRTSAARARASSRSPPSSTGRSSRRSAAAVRVLMVGGGCRGLALARSLVAEGHAVRAVTRDESKRARARGARAASAGSATPTGSGRCATRWRTRPCCCGCSATVDVPELHGSRLEMMLERTVDTTVRGVLYEGRCRRRRGPGGARPPRHPDRVPRRRIPATSTRGSPTRARGSTRCWLLVADRRRMDDRRVRAVPRRADVRVGAERRQQRDRGGDQPDRDEHGDGDGQRGADALMARDRGVAGAGWRRAAARPRSARRLGADGAADRRWSRARAAAARRRRQRHVRERRGSARGGGTTRAGARAPALAQPASPARRTRRAARSSAVDQLGLVRAAARAARQVRVEEALVHRRQRRRRADRTARARRARSGRPTRARVRVRRSALRAPASAVDSSAPAEPDLAGDPRPRDVGQRRPARAPGAAPRRARAARRRRRARRGRVRLRPWRHPFRPLFPLAWTACSERSPLVVAVVALCGCGSSGDKTTSTPATPPAATLQRRPRDRRHPLPARAPREPLPRAPRAAARRQAGHGPGADRHRRAAPVPLLAAHPRRDGDHAHRVPRHPHLHAGPVLRRLGQAAVGHEGGVAAAAS